MSALARIRERWPRFTFSRGVPAVLVAAPVMGAGAFVATAMADQPILAALRCGLSSLAAGVMAAVVVAVVGLSADAVSAGKWGRFLALRLVVPAMGFPWYWVFYRRELVTLGDLTVGFASIAVAAFWMHRGWVRERYFQADPRTLGAFRIVHGFLLVAHAIRHWAEARWYYSNEGVLTNHYHLFRPTGGTNLSLFHAFSSLPEVHVAFLILTLVHLLYLIGYRTRLFAILSFVGLTSLDSRLVLVENGGYVVANILTAWAMFMPTGLRFSVDAWRRSYREHRERSWEDLNRRFRPEDQTAPHVSAIYLLAIVNIAFIYFFNVVNKSGRIWRAGDTVHYVLHLDRMVTGLAVFFRELMPLWITKIITWATLVVEALIFTWIIWPSQRRLLRPLAMLHMHVLHTLFGTMFRLGPFSWFMIGWSYLLPTREHWEGIEARARRDRAVRRVVLDSASPLAFWLGRLFSRLDTFDRLVFEPSPIGATGGGARRPLVVVRVGDRDLTGTPALREIVRALPCGKILWPLKQALSLGTAGLLWSALDRRRDGISRFFGLRIGETSPPELPVGSPLGKKLGWMAVRARESLIGYLGVCAVLQAFSENKSIPPQLKPHLPGFVQATVAYPRMFQGWGMFSANPITDDGAVSIDAITLDGRHVDPFTGREPDLNLSDARGLGLGQIRQDYWNRIRLERNKGYRQGLKEYLLHWHKETGNPNDELAAFDVYWLRDQCPEPGKDAPTAHEKIAILTYRKPGYVPPPGVAPLPPEPKVGNADSPQNLQTEDRKETKPEEKRDSTDTGK